MMKNSKNVLSPLSCFLFNGMAPEEKERAATMLSPPTVFRKGDVLFPLPDAAPGLGILLAGKATVLRAGTDGKEQECHRLGVGDAFGAATLFSENAAVSSVLAESDGTVQLLSEATVLALMHRFPTAGENLVRFLTDRIRYLNRSLNGLRGGTAAQRLLTFLQSRADEAGHVTLPSMAAVAAALDMGRTSLYRAFDELEQAGALTRNGKSITLIRSHA